MGTKGRSFLGDKADHIVELLNKALADEWLAYYQYWIGSKVVVGPMKGEVTTELIEHAADELRHADMLVLRITQLGGPPLTHRRIGSRRRIVGMMHRLILMFGRSLNKI